MKVAVIGCGLIGQKRVLALDLSVKPIHVFCWTRV
jgi:hypothetical protein